MFWSLRDCPWHPWRLGTNSRVMVKSTADMWTQWEISFVGHLDPLPALQLTTVLTELHKIELLPQFSGNEGRRHIDALQIANRPPCQMCCYYSTNYGTQDVRLYGEVQVSWTCTGRSRGCQRYHCSDIAIPTVVSVRPDNTGVV